jgi:hypothetical protein
MLVEMRMVEPRSRGRWERLTSELGRETVDVADLGGSTASTVGEGSMTKLIEPVRRKGRFVRRWVATVEVPILDCR